MNEQVVLGRIESMPLLSRRLITIFLVSFFLFGLWSKALGSEQETAEVAADHGQWVGLGANSADEGGISENSGNSRDAGAKEGHCRGVGLAAGQYRGIYEGELDTQVFFPLVKNEHVGRTTGFFVQNASDGPMDMVAVFRVQGQYREKQYKNVPPNSSIFVLPGDANVPPGLGQVGSLTVVAPGPIAGSAVEFEAGVSIADNLQASRGFTPAEADNILYCPLFRNAHAKRLQTTGIQVQNVAGDGSSAKVTLTYRVSNSSTVVVFTHENPIPDGGSITFWGVSSLAQPQGIKLLSGDASLLEKTAGSVEIAADQPIVAIANETSYGADASGQDAKNYEGFNN